MWFQSYVGIVFVADQPKRRHEPVLLQSRCVSRCPLLKQFSRVPFASVVFQARECPWLFPEQSSYFWHDERKMPQSRRPGLCWFAARWVKINCRNGMCGFFFSCLLCFFIPLVKIDNMNLMDCQVTLLLCQGKLPNHRAAFSPPSPFWIFPGTVSADMRQLHYLWIDHLWWAHSRCIKVQISAFFKPQVNSGLTSVFLPPTRE